MAEISTGSSITFDSGFFAEILDIGAVSATREALQTSHMGTTTAHTFTPADLVDWGTLSVTIQFDPTTKPAMNGAAETVTITFPNSATSTWAFSGFMTSFSETSSLEEISTADCEIKISGDVTVTP